MNRFVFGGLVTVLATLGIGFLLLFAFAVDWSHLRDPSFRDFAAVGAFGLMFLIGAVMLVLARTRRAGQSGAAFPPVWAGVALLILAVASGGIAAYWDVLPPAEPLIAVAAVIGLFLSIGRLVSRWAPGALSRRTILWASLWGMFAATSIAAVLQILLAVGAIGAVFGGLALADPSLVRGFLDRIREQGSLDSFDGDIIRTLTVASGMFAMYAVVAPLTEEFAKMVGVAVVLRGATAGAYVHFVAGASVGLGFAVVETLGYATAAGAAWPLLIIVRAPVAFIHVTGTALASYGLYRQRARGGYRLVPYFLAAVLVHGAWNGLSVAVMLLSSEADTVGSPAPGVVLLLLMVVGLMALLLTGSVAWTTLSARKLGRVAIAGHGQPASDATWPPRTISGITFEHSRVRGFGS